MRVRCYVGEEMDRAALVDLQRAGMYLIIVNMWVMFFPLVSTKIKWRYSPKIYYLVLWGICWDFLITDWELHAGKLALAADVALLIWIGSKLWRHWKDDIKKALGKLGYKGKALMEKLKRKMAERGPVLRPLPQGALWTWEE